MERAIFVKQSEFAATARASSEPYNNRVVSVIVPGFKEEVEHPETIITNKGNNYGH